MRKYLHNITPFSPIVLLTTLLVISILFYKLALAYYEAKYTESAHVGVNRTGVSSFGYAVGNCVHCHEQKASIGGAEPSPTGGPDKFLVFAPMNPSSQTDNFCFQCHKGASSVQVSGITNYTYSKNFGGGAITFTNIYDAFNTATGSSHNLSDVLNRAAGNWGFTSNDSACVVCHNPHTAQRNYPPTINALNGVNTAVRYHGHHDDQDYNLWGDEPKATSGLNEMMSDWTVKYQAPYRADSGYEPGPAGSTIQNGSNLPNFVVSCRTGCHRSTAIYSTERGRNLQPVNWTNDSTEPGIRSVHGKADWASKNNGYQIAPYTDNTINHVLSCTDCHEPHGSPNKWLLRTTVNGKDVSGVTDDSYTWYEFCTACHVLTSATGSYHKKNNTAAPDCDTCHYYNCSNPF